MYGCLGEGGTFHRTDLKHVWGRSRMNSSSLASQTVHVLYFDIRHTEDWERGDALSEPAAAGSI